MEVESKRVAPSDEELGAALRKIATALGRTPDSWAYYAKQFVDWSSNAMYMRTLGSLRVRRVKVFVQPSKMIDGVLEHLVEMMVPAPGSAEPPFVLANDEDRIVIAVERIYSDAVYNHGMTPSGDAQPHWDKIIRGEL